MDIICDIDGTICEELPRLQRSLAKPLPGAMESINKLVEDGHTVIFYSARDWGEYRVTEDWLQRHGFKYHRLILGKPVAQIWIDDRSIQFTDWKTTNAKLKKIK